MTHTPDPRVDVYIDAQPDWQRAICLEVRELVHAAAPVADLPTAGPPRPG